MNFFSDKISLPCHSFGVTMYNYSGQIHSSKKITTPSQNSENNDIDRITGAYFYYSCLSTQARCREEQISCLDQKSCLNQTLFNLLFHFRKSEILLKWKILLKLDIV